MEFRPFQVGRHARTALPLALSVLLAACGGGEKATGDTVAGASEQAGARAMAAAAGSETALTPVTVTATGSERADLSASAAIDHDNATRWSSAFSDDQSITLDYGRSVSISRVRIDWERAHATQYLLQVSDDGSNWTTIKTVDNSAGDLEDWTGLNGQGRYLRMQGVKRSSQYGYSIFEIQAFSGTAAPPAPTPDPTPTPTPTPTPPVDTSKPGVSIKPVAATSSALENQGATAAMAIDGNATTRWASSFEDGAWIQFDFGARTQVGYMKLTWENAYGKEYALQVSDDGKAWSQLRYVTSGKGGTEEFFNLNANSRYIRLQGVARATQYGYSLFEVEFKTPGSDNTMPVLATSPVKFPASGTGLAPLPTQAEPLETLQFTLADGTLVTRFGARGLARHGRERGEDWNEIGYGPNETVDPVTGLPVDKGPGNYLTFVPNYFKNRTWGFEIIDNSRVAGVTKPTLTVNQYNQVDFLPGGVAFFRAFDRVGVTGYGWMNPGELVDRSLTVCKPVAYPANGRLASANGINNGCTLLIKDYPGHGDIGADGFPNGKNVPARPLVAGDVIEVSPSFFSTKEAMAAKGDNGGIRYYSQEWIYVVGSGLKPWYGVQPRLNSVPLPEETLSGGQGSVSYNYTDNALFIFQQPHNHVGMQNVQRFVEGRRLIHTNFTTGDHNEPGNDRNTAEAGLQGPRYNQSACIGCHVNNGRSPAPVAVNQRLDTMSVRTAVHDASGQVVPHPRYGMAVQMNARSSSGTPADWGNSVRVAGFETQSVKLADGTAVELRKPKLGFDGPVPELVSLRSAQPMIGVGLLEAVPEADILARVRTAADEDGVKGQANYVFDPETGLVRLGRFGWKAGKASLRHQAAAALLQDMSVTSPVYPSRDCLAGSANCAAGKAEPGISDADLQQITRYLGLLAVPAQRSLASGFPKGVSPLPELAVDPVQVAAGAKVFQNIRCVACHTAEMKTGSGHALAEVRNQAIRPYSDLLLHDMGAGLADNFAEGLAAGSQWRTAPLWGIGYTDRVIGTAGKAGFLHDGRARTLTEAIMWHGGEADKARQRFANLATADRQALLAFLQSL
jgi:CxxC motif-containing protein (DUF1111 family)